MKVVPLQVSVLGIGSAQWKVGKENQAGILKLYTRGRGFSECWAQERKKSLVVSRIG